MTGDPNSIGRKSTIRTDADVARMRRFHNSPMPADSVFRGTIPNWPMVSPELRTPYIFGELAILGGDPCLGFGNGIDHELAALTKNAYFPSTIARRALGAVVSHYEEGLYAED